MINLIRGVVQRDSCRQRRSHEVKFFGGSSGPAPVAIPVTPPAPLFPGLAGTISAQGPGALQTATTAQEGAASGLDVQSIYQSIVDASRRQEAEGQSQLMASMGAGGMSASSDAMRSVADYQLQFQANLLKQLQEMQFTNEALKLQGAQGLMETYGNAALAFAPTEEVLGTSAGPSVFSQVAGAATGGAMAAAMLMMAFCWIAAELYGGWEALETYWLRAYLASCRGVIGRSFVRLYLRFGQQIAQHIKGHKRSRKAVKLLFDWLISRAFNWRLKCHNRLY